MNPKKEKKEKHSLEDPLKLVIAPQEKKVPKTSGLSKGGWPRCF